MSQPPRNHVNTAADVSDAVYVIGEVCGSNEVIGDSDIVPLQFFATGYGAAITALQVDDAHRVFLNPNGFGNSQKSFGEAK